MRHSAAVHEIGAASLKRLKPSPKRATEGLDSLSDESRIVACAAFRRLQNKAQVFSLARTGEVRTRLTHSLEVSNYGKLIAESVSVELLKRGHLSESQRLSFVQTAANACLLHDIGNPPFGHMGEYAIGQWFKDHKQVLVDHWVKQKELTAGAAERLHAAFEWFDGNPQGLRIITRLQWLGDEYGLNLSCPLLGAYLKYLGAAVDKGSRLRKKLGFFPSERAFVERVWEQLGLLRGEDGLPAQRHPLAYIMEAADDIAFCLSDIEDAIEKRVVSERRFLDEIEPHVKAEVATAKEKGSRFEGLALGGTFHLFRLAVSTRLVAAATAAYLANEEAILDGTMTESLLATDAWSKETLKALKTFASANIYTARETIEIELSGLRAIKGILDAFLPLLLLSRAEFERLASTDDAERFRDQPVAVLLYTLLPAKHLQAYRWQTKNGEPLEPVHRTQLVVDYISGMTDSHALKIFSMINGHLRSDIE